MNEIIDVEYKVIESLEEKSTEILTAEANNLWEQMEAIGAFGLMLAAQAGQRLNVIKERIPHGEWENWCNDNLKFSYRKASRLMNLAQKTSDENSIFSNLPTLADIEISKVYELLAAPEEAAKEVIENNDLSDITVRELREELKKSKEALKSRDYDLEALQESIRTLEAEKESLIEASKEAESDNQKIEKIEQNLRATEEKLKVVEEKLKKEKAKAKEAEAKAVEKTKAEAEESMKQAIEKAKEEARQAVSQDIESLKADLEAVLKENEKLEKSAKNSSNKELAVFKVKSDQLQSDFNSCLESIKALEREDAELAGKANAALKQILNILIEKL